MRHGAVDPSRRTSRLVPRSLIVAAALVASSCASTTQIAANEPATRTTPTTAEPTATSPAAPSPDPTQLGDATPPPLPTPVEVAPVEWKPCGRLDCAVVAVPLDYSSTTSPRIELALRRHRANGNRIGALLVNPGGPGGSGTGIVEWVAARSPALADRFDIIGWDPRGVADSIELSCDGPLERFYANDPSPDDAGERKEIEDAAEAVAAACFSAAPDLLGSIGTDAVVEDLDAIRVALDETKISYLGFSYGTDIGLVYAARHGDHLRAAVLDGVLDPTTDLETWLTGQALATEATLSRTLGDAVADLDAVLAGAEAGTLDVTPAEVARAAISSTYRADGGGRLRQALDRTLDGSPGALRSMAEAYLDGSTFDVYTAVSCADRPHPRSVADYRAFVARLTTAAPRIGAAVANELLPCAFWPTPGAVPLEELRQPLGPVVLVLGNTGDSATPYAGTLDVVDRLDRAALLTYDGEGHTSFLAGSGCIDLAVETYLTTLDVPEPGTVCN